MLSSYHIQENFNLEFQEIVLFLQLHIPFLKPLQFPTRGIPTRLWLHIKTTTRINVCVWPFRDQQWSADMHSTASLSKYNNSGNYLLSTALLQISSFDLQCSSQGVHTQGPARLLLLNDPTERDEEVNKSTPFTQSASQLTSKHVL